MANNRSSGNAIMTVQHAPPPLIPRWTMDERCQSDQLVWYRFIDFPIKMDNTSFNVMGRYTVGLLHMPQFDMIFIHVKWMGVPSSYMCAMISFGSTENEIREAVKECADNLEHYDYLVRNGARYPASKCSEKYLASRHISVIDKVNKSFPAATYWCTLCDFPMRNIQHVRIHLGTYQHFQKEQIRIVENLPHIKEPYEWTELERLIMGSYEKTRVRRARINEVLEFVDRVRTHLQNEFKKPVRLHIFGSLLNGFGVSNSDVDVCFRFHPDDQPQDVNGVKIIHQIAKYLQQMKEVDMVDPITKAKVPIVKFKWTKLGMEGDISYYNVLALSNTQLLKKYCSWDVRVAPLGVWIKQWAKSCDIGNASRGSLSSYAFNILLLHYLQNCDPPVLPRLQEDFRDPSTQPIIVENCDVYFHREVIPGWSKNERTIGELFVGFLDYYARFDFGTQIVQIRRKKPLRKMEKDWYHSIYVEDPFRLHRNLASGVSREMFLFIVGNIHKSRKLFMLSDVRRKFLESKSQATDQEMPVELYDSYADTLLKECKMGPAPSYRRM